MANFLKNLDNREREEKGKKEGQKEGQEESRAFMKKLIRPQENLILNKKAIGR